MSVNNGLIAGLQKKENRRLEMERETLKKAAAFFANESKRGTFIDEHRKE